MVDPPKVEGVRLLVSQCVLTEKDIFHPKAPCRNLGRYPRSGVPTPTPYHGPILRGIHHRYRVLLLRVSPCPEGCVPDPDVPRGVSSRHGSGALVRQCRRSVTLRK